MQVAHGAGLVDVLHATVRFAKSHDPNNFHQHFGLIMGTQFVIEYTHALLTLLCPMGLTDECTPPLIQILRVHAEIIQAHAGRTINQEDIFPAFLLAVADDAIIASLDELRTSKIYNDADIDLNLIYDGVDAATSNESNLRNLATMRWPMVCMILLKTSLEDMFETAAESPDINNAGMEFLVHRAGELLDILREHGLLLPQDATERDLIVWLARIKYGRKWVKDPSRASTMRNPMPHLLNTLVNRLYVATLRYFEPEQPVWVLRLMYDVLKYLYRLETDANICRRNALADGNEDEETCYMKLARQWPAFYEQNHSQPRNRTVPSVHLILSLIDRQINPNQPRNVIENNFAFYEHRYTLPKKSTTLYLALETMAENAYNADNGSVSQCNRQTVVDLVKFLRSDRHTSNLRKCMWRDAGILRTNCLVHVMIDFQLAFDHYVDLLLGCDPTKATMYAFEIQAGLWIGPSDSINYNSVMGLAYFLAPHN